MRRLHINRLVAFVGVAVAFWFLNYNSSLQRYDDLIRSCNFTKTNVYAPIREGSKADVEYIRQVIAAASVKKDVKDAAEIKLVKVSSAVRSLGLVVHTPCEERFKAPGIFG